MNAAQRRSHLLTTALMLAKSGSYAQITQGELSKAADVSRGTITYHFDNMDCLRVEIMREAIRTNDYEVIAQGLAVKDPIALTAPETAKANAAAFLRNA